MSLLEKLEEELAKLKKEKMRQFTIEYERYLRNMEEMRKRDVAIRELEAKIETIRKVKEMRLSKVALKKGARRPEVFLLQEALNTINNDKIAVDGIFGRGTDEVVQKFQENSLEVDGVVGRGTWGALLPKAYLEGFKPNLQRRVQSLICLYETGHAQDAYGFAEGDIGDGAGANYGVVQHNALGSMKTLLRMAGRMDLWSAYSADKSKARTEIRDWFRTSESIKAQDKYFKKIIWDRALRELKQIPQIEDWVNSDPDCYERAVLLMCDSIVQNGAFFSPNRKPFWNTLTDEERKLSRNRELYYGNDWDRRMTELSTYAVSPLNEKYFFGNVEEKKKWTGKEELPEGYFKDFWYQYLQAAKKKKVKKPKRVANREAFLTLATRLSPKGVLVLMAMWRARTSRSKYWRDVEKRRMVAAVGEGRVHGETINPKSDYGIPFEG